jgi:hypothetical protein
MAAPARARDVEPVPPGIDPAIARVARALARVLAEREGRKVSAAEAPDRH